MKRILSREKQKSKERFNQLLIGIIFIFLLILSVFGLRTGYDEEQDNEKIVYNGLEFIKNNGFWIMNAQGMQFAFRYNPKEVNIIPGNVSYLDAYVDEPLYIQSDNSEASSEIYINLNQIAQRIQYACLNNTNCTGDYPIKDCDSNFIVIKKDNITGIEQDNSCVFLQGPEEDIVKIADEFLFKIMGIQ